MEHCSFLTVFPAPLRKPPSPSNPLRVPRSKASTNRKVLTPLQGINPGFYSGEAFFSITIPNPAKVFRPPSKPLYCVRQCNGRYHSASEHGSYLSVPSAPLTRPALPSQSCRHRRRSPHRVCPASRTRPAAAIRRYGRSRALPTQTNSLSFY